MAEVDDKRLTYLKDRISSKLPKLLEIIETDYRKTLDDRVTILDLGYEALKVNVYRGTKLSDRELSAYNIIYDKLIGVVRTAAKAKTVPSLDSDRFTKLFTAAKSVGAILVDTGDRNNIFLVGKNFDAIRNFVTKYISANPALKATRFGSITQQFLKEEKTAAGKTIYTETSVTRSKVDIGHIPTEGSENLQSPLEQKIQSVLEFASANGMQDTKIAGIANQALKDLYNIQADVAYNFKNTATEAIQTAKKVLGDGYLVVTLHTQKKNNEFSKIEKRIYDKLVYELALICSDATNFPGSNTIQQDIRDSLLSLFTIDKNLKAIKVKPHKRQSGTTGKKKLDIKLNKATSAGSLAPNPQVVLAKAAQATDLTSLMNLINTHLQDVVSANMGSGSSRNILNYRTGRLAASAKVENMSESRNGMITAFYSYMKNPYATFSEGGRQQNPKSRDPKLLISTAIREIAAQRVANRLRAVVV